MENDEFPTNNGAVLTIAQIIKVVMSSAAGAEIGALYINSREAIPQRHLLEEMGHPQPPTPIQINNTTALGVVTNTIQPKRTKDMDMRFHWLRCRKKSKAIQNLLESRTNEQWRLRHETLSNNSSCICTIHIFNFNEKTS